MMASKQDQLRFIAKIQTVNRGTLTGVIRDLLEIKDRTGLTLDEAEMLRVCRNELNRRDDVALSHSKKEV